MPPHSGSASDGRIPSDDDAQGNSWDMVPGESIVSDFVRNKAQGFKFPKDVDMLPAADADKVYTAWSSRRTKHSVH